MERRVKREVEITLHSINIPVTGAGLDTTTSHLLTTDLVWPRVGVARKSASQSCTLQEGTADFETANWGRRILFKETVEGRFALAVTVTEALDDEELEKILRFWAGAALAIGADAVDSAAGPLGGLAPRRWNTQPKRWPSIQARRCWPRAGGTGRADFPPSGGERLLTVRLVAAASCCASRAARSTPFACHAQDPVGEGRGQRRGNSGRGRCNNRLETGGPRV